MLFHELKDSTSISTTFTPDKMAYNYSNPYAPQPMEVINKSQPSTPTSYTVLFGGLPKDVRELQLKVGASPPIEGSETERPCPC